MGDLTPTGVRCLQHHGRWDFWAPSETPMDWGCGVPEPNAGGPVDDKSKSAPLTFRCTG